MHETIAMRGCIQTLKSLGDMTDLGHKPETVKNSGPVLSICRKDPLLFETAQTGCLRGYGDFQLIEDYGV